MGNKFDSTMDDDPLTIRKNKIEDELTEKANAKMNRDDLKEIKMLEKENERISLFSREEGARLFDALQENAELREMNWIHAKKIMQLTAQLTVATETLEKIKDTYFDNNGPYVREKSNEALTKIKALK